jgi:hypothetical protein
MRLLLVARMHIVRGDGRIRAKMFSKTVGNFGCAKWPRVGFDQNKTTVDT